LSSSTSMIRTSKPLHEKDRYAGNSLIPYLGLAWPCHGAS
jgi:hypothetical protein